MSSAWPTEIVLGHVDGVWLVQDYVEPTVELSCELT